MNDMRAEMSTEREKESAHSHTIKSEANEDIWPHMGLLERFAISWRNIFRASSACSAHLPPSCNLCHRDAKPSFPIITKSLPLTAHNYADFYILFVLFGCRLTLYGSSLNKLFIPHFGVLHSMNVREILPTKRLAREKKTRCDRQSTQWNGLPDQT